MIRSALRTRFKWIKLLFVLPSFPLMNYLHLPFLCPFPSGPGSLVSYSFQITPHTTTNWRHGLWWWSLINWLETYICTNLTFSILDTTLISAFWVLVKTEYWSILIWYYRTRKILAGRLHDLAMLKFRYSVETCPHLFETIANLFRLTTK